MKSNLKKRILAAVLCMVMVFSGSSFAMAGDADTTAENGTEVSQDAGTTTTSSGEESQEQTTSGETTVPAQENGGQTETTTPETTTPDTAAPETTTETQETETAPGTVTEEPVQSPAFEGSYTLEDGSAVFHAAADENVFPEGTYFKVSKIEKESPEYQKVEEGLMDAAEEEGKGLIDFAAYDITFYNTADEEIEPEGEVEISVDFLEKLDLHGVASGNEVNVKHIKDDTTVEEVEGEVVVKETEVQEASFTTGEFSIYAITTSGIQGIDSSTVSDEYVTIEFWDSKQTNTDIRFSERKPGKIDNIYATTIEIFVDNESVETIEGYLYGSDDEVLHNTSYEPRTTVWPGEGYYFAQQCVWKKLKSQTNKETSFTGSGTTGFNADDEYKLSIYLKTTTENNCSSKITEGIAPISVDLYNYDSDAYNEYVINQAGERKEDALLIRSPWTTTYKNNDYQVDNADENGQNKSSGDGVYYGLVGDELDANGNIHFMNKAAFFDNDFVNTVGEKYSDVSFEFLYDSATHQYTYNSDVNHVHFDGATVSQYRGAGPGTASDGTDLERNGFFPFTNEDANMTDYGFGMKLEVEFNLTEDKKIGGDNIAFKFSGDDDVWVFVDGKLVLDLGGLHAKRTGTIDFVDGVSYGNGSGYGAANGSSAPNLYEVNSFLKELSSDKTHTLTMYYLERGGDQSNCMIQFNLPVVEREGTLEFDKTDESGKRLGNAVFGLYETEEQINNDEPVATAESDEDGPVTFDISEFEEGTYYLKEISAPWGYTADPEVYTVTVTETEQGTGADKKIDVSGMITKKGSQDKITAIVNQKNTSGTGGTTNVTVTKKWDSSANEYETPVEITLYSGEEAAGQKVERDDNPVTLSEDNNWTYTWESLSGDTNYYVEETKAEGFEFKVDYDYKFEVNSDFTKYTPCSDTYYELGSNAVIAIFGGGKWEVWTSEKLENTEQQKLASVLTEKGLTNGGGINQKTTEFYSGNATLQLQGYPFNITVDPKKGVLLNFGESCNWSLFYMGTYTKDVDATVTNSLDIDKTINIPVIKVWKGDESQFHYDDVTVQLYQNGEAYLDPVKIKRNENWRYIFISIPFALLRHKML